MLFTARDEFALPWVCQQYAIRLDHFQWLLGTYPGRGSTYEHWISESSARDVVDRWEKGKWARTKGIRRKEPFWIWPSRLGMRKAGLTYSYWDLEQSSLKELNHLYAINEIRLFICNEEDTWISERQLLQGVQRVKGHELLHRPDGEIHFADGDIVSIEAELSGKKEHELAENLVELIRGEEYLRLKADYGWRAARSMSAGEQSPYSEIWYFAPEKIRKQVRRERAKLVERGDLSEEEAQRLVVRWYPVVKTDEEEAQEEQEESAVIHLTQEEIDREPPGGEEVRPGGEGKDEDVG